MKVSITLPALLVLAATTGAQQKLASVQAPERALGWLDAPRAIALELFGTRHLIRTIADLDLDGRMELIVADSGAVGPVLSVAQIGPGAYGLAGSIGSNRTGLSMGVGDLDGSGYPDVVMNRGIFAQGAGFYLYRNAGGVLSEPLFFPTPNQPTTASFMAQADADPELELLEVFSVSSSQFMRWWDFDGTTLIPGRSLDLQSWAIRSVVPLDVDGDGLDEVALVKSGTASFGIFRTNGDLSLELQQALPLDHPDPGIVGHELASGDIDGDGFEDAIVSWYDPELGAGIFQVVANQAGNSMTVLGRQAHPSEDYLDRPVLADWDLDGDLDIMGGSSLMENTSGFVFQAAGFVSAFTSNGLPIADLNGDGYPDAVNFFGVKAGNGEFEDSGSQFLAVNGDAGIGDLDGDGDLDAVGQLGMVLVNDGAGAFTQVKIEDLLNPSLPFLPFQVRSVGDFDGDGIQDVIVWVDTSIVTFSEVLLRGVGGGSFANGGRAAPINLAITDAGRLELSPSDLDGDGDLDLLNSQGWAENDGTGYFSTVHAAWSDRPQAVADVDGDGDLDVAARVGSTSVLFRNNGAGTFSQHALAPTSLTEGLFADFNRDGFPEYVTESGFDTLEVFQNSAGSFTLPALSLPLGDSLESILLAEDFDGDGYSDLLATTSGVLSNNELTLIWRLADPAFLSFDAPRRYTSLPSLMVAGDFDGDGDRDLLGTRLTKNLRSNPRRKVRSLR